MKKTQYFSHDSNARHDPKIKALVNKYGPCGYAHYFMIVEILREQENYKYDLKKRYNKIAMAQEIYMQEDELVQFVETCVEYELLEMNGESISSKSLTNRMKLMEEMTEKKKVAGRMGAQKRYNPSVLDDLVDKYSSAIAEPKQSHSSAIAEHSNKINKEINKKKNVNKQSHSSAIAEPRRRVMKPCPNCGAGLYPSCEDYCGDCGWHAPIPIPPNVKL